MSWLSKLMPSQIRTEGGGRKSVPEGLWAKCESCSSVLYRVELERNLEVCPKCGDHRRIGAQRRLDQFLDEEPRILIGDDITPSDPLRFRDTKKYRDRLVQAQKDTDLDDALIAVQSRLKGLEVVVCAFDFFFMGGSMGSVVGERFVRAVNTCIKHQLPFICFSASGGARMQEGLFSLMQMAKTSAALARLSERTLPFISIMTNSTMGGVSASLAMLGDINIAEPKALIGFAGPRVIQQTVRQTLPEGFQRSEFLLEHGAIDMIVDRRELRDRVHRLLCILTRQPAAEEN